MQATVVNPGTFDPSNKINSTTDTTVLKKAGKIIGAIQGFGSVVALGALVYIGIRYMIGSTEEKAMYKETMIPYLIGSILLFASVNVVGAIYDALM